MDFVSSLAELKNVAGEFVDDSREPSLAVGAGLAVRAVARDVRILALFVYLISSLKLEPFATELAFYFAESSVAVRTGTERLRNVSFFAPFM
mmetsp:Transcript_49177/g.115538  ORF Transcript_49177/g.115538 Transcript_49177/m.115538 type:complete len:92 (-) Transcript_49177:431-706(-)